MTNEGDGNGDRESPNGIPIVTKPPPRLDDEYVRAKLHAISLAVAKQAKVEAERAGASKFTARLLALFGTVITAGAVAGFGWVWSVQASTADHESRLHTLETNPHAEHGHRALDSEIGDVDGAVEEVDDRVDGLDASTKVITQRLDRIEREQAERHSDVMQELRRLRGTRRTWGGE